MNVKDWQRCPICKEYDTEELFGRGHRCKPAWEIVVWDEQPAPDEQGDRIYRETAERAVEQAVANFESLAVDYQPSVRTAWLRPAWDRDEETPPPAWTRYDVECETVRDYHVKRARQEIHA